MDSGEHPGVPQRPPASAHLLIDSLDRYDTVRDVALKNPNNPGNNFTVSKKVALLYGYFTRLGITQIQLQYRAPTIIPGINDEFLIYDSVNQDYYPVDLSGGYYTATSLAAAIQAAVLALPGTPFPAFTCTYTAATGGFVMACPTVAFAIATEDAAPGATDAQLRLWERTFNTIGGTYSNVQLFSGTTQQLGTPQLLYTRWVDIVSDRLTKFQRVKDADTLLTNKTNIVARVYLTAPNTRVDPTAGGGPFDLTWDPNTPKHIKWSPNEAVHELDFRLFDEYGEPLYWSPRADTEFQLTIVASET